MVKTVVNSTEIWERLTHNVVLSAYACINWYCLGSDQGPYKYNSNITLLNYSLINKYFI
jgi:hypothetical protein